MVPREKDLFAGKRGIPKNHLSGLTGRGEDSRSAQEVSICQAALEARVGLLMKKNSGSGSNHTSGSFSLLAFPPRRDLVGRVCSFSFFFLLFLFLFFFVLVFSLR